MTDGDILLRSIIASPADDAPRLAYADWLDEQGRDAQARYIRMAIDLARNTTASYGHAVRVVLRGLEAKFGHEWFPLPMRTRAQVLAERKRPHGGCCNDYCDQTACDCLERAAMYQCRRGFLKTLVCATDDFCTFAGTVFAFHPIERVGIPELHPYRTVSGLWGWGNEDDAADTPRAALPGRVWDCLVPDGNGTRRGYGTEWAALSALSDALVVVGRRMARLGVA